MITAGDAMFMAGGFAIIAIAIMMFGSRDERPLGCFFELLAFAMLMICLLELI